MKTVDLYRYAIQRGRPTAPQRVRYIRSCKRLVSAIRSGRRGVWGIRSSISQIGRRPTWSPIRPPRIPAAPPRQPLAVANMRLLRLVSRTTDLDHVAPHASAMHPHQPSRAVGRSENKSTLRKKLHRCVDANECEAPMRDQAETKLSPPTESWFLRHSTLDEQCFSRVVIKKGIKFTVHPIPILRMGLNWLRKVSVLVSANDRS